MHRRLTSLFAVCGALGAFAVVVAACSTSAAAPLATTTAPATVRPVAPATTAAPEPAPAVTDAPQSPLDLVAHHLDLGGRTRTWVSTTPPHPELPHPLVVVLHGRGGTGKAMHSVGFAPLAAAANVELVYPDGVDGSWNDERPGVDSVAHIQHVDDQGFVSAVIDQAIATDNVTATDVSLVGFSNGALFADFYVCHNADRLAAVVLVSGAGGSNLPSTCQPDTAISVLEIHGTADRTVPFDGGPIALDPAGRSRGVASPVRAMLTIWAARDQCVPSATTTEPGPPVVHDEVATCLAHTSVAVDLVDAGTHDWLLGVGLDTTARAWHFLDVFGTRTVQ